MTSNRLASVFRLIDEANSVDPNMVETDAGPRPAAQIYGERMSAMLQKFRPDADELLRIAARAQHIERWKSPRSDYPDGRAGYLRWRTELKAYHARRACKLMEQVGYDDGEIERVGSLIRKERLKRDVDVQALEDVVCLVFLSFYAEEFIVPHDDEKVIGILAKTVRKMSPEGVAAVGGFSLPERLRRLLTLAVAA